MSGTVDQMPQPSGHNEVDDTDLGFELGEDFEVIFSAERPAGYTGKWAQDRSRGRRHDGPLSQL